MKARIVGVAVAVKAALVSKEARGPEMAILRLVAVAVSAKVGIDLVSLVS